MRNAIEGTGAIARMLAGAFFVYVANRVLAIAGQLAAGDHLAAEAR